MERKNLEKLLISILNCELNETELPVSVKEQLNPDIVSILYSLAKHHDLAHIVASSLYKNGLPVGDELAAKLNRAEILSVYRHEQMKYAYEEICRIFDEGEIPYIPLKGSVIRPYYPKESMRTSCDIDILIREDDLERAIERLTQAEYRCGEREYHDVSLFSPNNIHLELHFNIREGIENLDAVLDQAWEHALVQEGSRYGFSEEFFLFHMLAHMSYHFLSGGFGIRPLMDLWVIEHKMGLDIRKAEALLKQAGIDRFSEEISRLVEICFSGAEKDDFSELLLSYIFDGGTYGTAENKIAMKKSTSKSTFVYAWQRVFLPYRKMVYHFPVLKKCPILLPFCWIARVCKMLFGGKAKKTVEELQTANRTDEETLDAMAQMRERLGL